MLVYCLDVRLLTHFLLSFSEVTHFPRVFTIFYCIAMPVFLRHHPF
jgi:hypothetical protein